MSKDNETLVTSPGWVGKEGLGADASPVGKRQAPRPGSILAVVGAKGSPGASELAASFAALVADEHSVLLVDLDADGGGLSQRLGAEVVEEGFLGLAHAVAEGERDPGALLDQRVAGGSRGWPAVLPGAFGPKCDLAAALAPGLLARVLRLLCARYPLIVCDLGHRLRQHGGGDLAARLHREVAIAADAHVIVLGSRPEQLRAGLDQLDLLLEELAIVPEALRVAINGQPGLGSPRAAGAGGRISDDLAARGLVVDAWLPFDERALRCSSRSGSPLAAARPRGPYARAVAALASEVLLPSPPRPARRKRRLVLERGQRRRAAAADQEIPLPWRRA